MLQNTLQRFDILFPKLIKNKKCDANLDVKDSLIYSLAKTEIISILQDQKQIFLVDLLQQLRVVNQDIATDQQQGENKQYHIRDLFVIYLLLHFSNKNVEQNGNLLDLYLMIFDHLCSNFVSGADIQILDQKMSVISQIVKSILKTNSHDLIGALFNKLIENCEESLSPEIKNLYQKYQVRIISFAISSKQFDLQKQPDLKQSLQNILQNALNNFQNEKFLIDFICDLFHKFSVIFEKTFVLNAGTMFYESILQNQENGDDSFILQDQLTIMSKLNLVFGKYETIVNQKRYWELIENGLNHQDLYCRKQALSILSQNVQFLINDSEQLIKYNVNKKEFESKWGTLFEVYEVLETQQFKKIESTWAKTEMLFNYLNDHHLPHNNHPLINFQTWLRILIQRGFNHQNQQIRNIVQKSMFKRSYVSKSLLQFVCSDLIQSIDSCIIGENSDLILNFYLTILKNESQNLKENLQQLFGLLSSDNLSNEVISIVIQILASSNFENENIEFIGYSELIKFGNVLLKFQQDKNMYFIKASIIKIIRMYVHCSQMHESEFQGQFLIILGQMPFELFSVSNVIIFTDREGLSNSVKLVDKMGLETIQNMLKSFLFDIFQVKAPLNAIPKFLGGNQMMDICNGITRLILILDAQFEDSNAIWFYQVMQENLEIFYGQVLTSSYLSPEVIDQKIMCFTLIYNDLLKFSSTHKFRDGMIYQIKLGANQILDRIENCLLVPLSLYEEKTLTYVAAFQDKTKLHSTFGKLQTYCNYVAMIVRVYHIYQNYGSYSNQQSLSDSVIEKSIKLILNHVLKVTQLKPDPVTQQLSNIHNNGQNLGVFLWQYSVFELLFSILNSYSTGIKENISNNIDNLLVPNDIFTIGKSIVMNLIEFKPIDCVLSEKEDEDLLKIVEEYQLDLVKIKQRIMHNYWTIISEFLIIFGFDSELFSSVQITLYPQMMKQANKLLDNTNSISPGMFNELKITIIPVFVHRVQSQESDKQENIKAYQDICLKCFNIVKTQDLNEQQILDFVELVFSEEIIDLSFNYELQEMIEFYQKLSTQIFQIGESWVRYRTAFNHFISIFGRKPYLLELGFEHFLVKFSTNAEQNLVDSMIINYRQETLIPEVVHKQHETLNIDQITYQGAYIRFLTLYISEGIIKNTKTQIIAQYQSIGQIDVKTNKIVNLLESQIFLLLEMNKNLEVKQRSEMPYTQQHREKTRIWQTLLIFQQLLDPIIYTAQFRQLRLSVCGRDIICELRDILIDTINYNHSPAIRQYIEMFTIQFFNSFPSDTIQTQAFLSTLIHSNIRGQVNASFIIIAGWNMLNWQGSDQTFQKKIFETIIPFCTSNSAHARCFAQYFTREMVKDPKFKPFIPQGHEMILNFIDNQKELKGLLRKYDARLISYKEMINGQGVENILSTKIDEYGENFSLEFMEELKNLVSETFVGSRKLSGDSWFQSESVDNSKFNIQSVHLEKSQNQTETREFENFQKKTLAWSLVENSRQKEAKFERNQMIMCASLIDKAPNLAGLSRTCEIMNCKSLIVNNKEIIRAAEFKDIAISSEDWLPIYEVKETNLLNYLKFQKQNGFSLLGLEQTANSHIINEYKFPSKCILLLGKEKEGIPQEYLGLLDACIEIPQFGIVRSLNVHVSGAICMWEYSKQ